MILLWDEAQKRNKNIIIKTVISGRKPLIFINNHKKKLLVANSELQIVIFNVNEALSTNCCHFYFEVAIASWSLLTLWWVKNKCVNIWTFNFFCQPLNTNTCSNEMTKREFITVSWYEKLYIIGSCYGLGEHQTSDI